MEKGKKVEMCAVCVFETGVEREFCLMEMKGCEKGTHENGRDIYRVGDIGVSSTRRSEVWIVVTVKLAKSRVISLACTYEMITRTCVCKCTVCGRVRRDWGSCEAPRSLRSLYLKM